MMILKALCHFDWQLLRILARSKVPVTGKKLRHTPTRATKDGSFLKVLVEKGLIQVVTPNPNWKLVTYTLTKTGKHAAEYGEYHGELRRE